MAEPLHPDSREFAGEGLQPDDKRDGAGGAAGSSTRGEKVVDWKGFRTYLWEKEAGSWDPPLTVWFLL